MSSAKAYDLPLFSFLLSNKPSTIERMEKRCIVDMHYVIPEGPDVPKRQKRPSLRGTTEFVAGETKMSEGNNTDVAVPLYNIPSLSNKPSTIKCRKCIHCSIKI